MMVGERITVRAGIRAPLDAIWKASTTQDDITRWNFASPDWHCPSASVDLRVGGTFTSRMESVDGRAGIDFSGRHTEIRHLERIGYEMDDGRRVTIRFRARKDSAEVEVSFDPDLVHSRERQAEGRQAILENFHKCVEDSRRAKP